MYDVEIVEREVKCVFESVSWGGACVAVCGRLTAVRGWVVLRCVVYAWLLFSMDGCVWGWS